MRPLRSPGFTKRLLSELDVSRNFRPEEILYLTPNKRRARAAVFEILSLYKETSSRTPECLTLQVLAEKLVTLRPSKGILDERDRRFILLKLVRDSGKGFFREEHIGLLSELYAELCRYYPSNWEEILKLARDILVDVDTERRLEEALELLRKYDNHLEKERLIDHERLLGAALDLVGTLNHKLLLIEGYFEPWTVEQKLLEALLERIPEAVVIIPEDPLTSEAQSFFISNGLKPRQIPEPSLPPDSFWKRYRSREDEVIAIARRICSLCKEGVTPDEIMVVFPALEIYRPLLVRVFARYGLEANVSLRPKLLSYPPIRAVIDILAVAENKFRRRDVVALFLSPCFTKVPRSVKDWVDVLSRDEGIVSGASSWKNWFLSEPSHKLKGYGEHITKEILSFVKEFAARVEFFSTRQHVKVFSRKLLDTLEWLGWNARPELRKGLSEALAKLQRMTELSNEGELLPRFARETLEMLLKKEVELDEEDYSRDGIRVIPVVESRWLEVRYLFLGGLVDGEFPKYSRRDLLLSERMKEALSMPSRELSFLNAEFEFRRLECMPQNTIYLSAPSMEGDRPLLSSVFLVDREESIFAEDGTIYSTDELLASKAFKQIPRENQVAFTDNESTLLIEEKFGPQYPFKVTLLEVYRNCPYRYYLSTVLGLEPREEPSEEPEARLLGNVLHSVMEKLMSSNPKARTIEEQMREHLTLELNGMRLNPFVKIWIEDWIVSRIDWFRGEEEIREEKGWRIDPQWLERDIRSYFESGNFTLRGRVDRVDWMDSRAKVLDYKTGNEQGFASKLVKGESLQLPLYCEMTRRITNAEISSFGIYDFNKSAYIQIDPPEESIRNALSFAKEAVEMIRGGFFERPQKRPVTCFYCEYKEFCG